MRAMSQAADLHRYPTFPSLAEQVVLITGASSGIGAACAHAFAHSGCRLILTARRGDRLTELAEALRAEGAAEVHTQTLDVRDAAAVASLVPSLPPSLQAIDIVVNNAGLGRGRDKLHEGDPAEWDEMIDTNVKGLLRVNRAVLPQMVARDRGHIIHIGSIAGRTAYLGGTVYCASKAAVRMINECLKHDLLGTRIRVSTIDPGMVETEFSVVRFRGDAQRARAVYDGMTPMTAADVAESVLFCASRPAHVNISEVVMLATDQASPTSVHRRSV